MESTHHQNPYAMAEKILLFTATFSLAISMLIEAILLFSTRKTSAFTKRWLRRGLLSILAVNSVFSFGSLAFFTAIQIVNKHSEKLIKEGTGYEVGHPTYGAISIGQQGLAHGQWSQEESRRMIPWQLSCLGIFVFSVLLLVSAWLDLRDEKMWMRDEEQTFDAAFSSTIFPRVPVPMPFTPMLIFPHVLRRGSYAGCDWDTYDQQAHDPTSEFLETPTLFAVLLEKDPPLGAYDDLGSI
ncbi:hypothetical protein TruAng_001080 [Truncatella angustata]|nr:hypothetical protein TruAng_001080 [Truncatella angustata]